MKLTISDRTTQKKSDAKKIRRADDVPAVLYGKGKAPRSIFVKGVEIQTVLRKIEPQLLATTVFELSDGQRAIVKDVQYHPVSYAILHMDFQIVGTDLVEVNVPIRIQGARECAGVAVGGFIRQVIRSLKVRCGLDQLPREFVLDITNLGLAEVRRLSDIAIPEGVKPIAQMNEVAVVIAKKV